MPQKEERMKHAHDLNGESSWVVATRGRVLGEPWQAQSSELKLNSPLLGALSRGLATTRL